MSISLKSVKLFSSYKSRVSESLNGNLLTLEILGNLRLVSLKMTLHQASHSFSVLSSHKNDIIIKHLLP